jgi:hypothetical protein
VLANDWVNEMTERCNEIDRMLDERVLERTALNETIKRLRNERKQLDRMIRASNGRKRHDA